MSEPRSRIDALLNHSAPEGDAAAADPAAQEIPFVPAASPGGGAAGSEPLVYVDGKPVQPGADGSTDVDVTPAGAVAAQDADGSREGTAGRHDGSSNGGHAMHPGGGSGSGTGGAAHDGSGSGTGGAHDGSGSGTGGAAHDGSGSGTGGAHDGGGSGTAAQLGRRGGGAEQVSGTGPHAAKVDITDPSGKHHVPYHVHKNADGSVDVTVPKGPGHPHETRIHVPPGKHVDLKLSEDAKGHVKVQAKPAPPDASSAKPGDAQGAAGDKPQTPAGGDKPQMPAGGDKPQMPAGGGPSGGGPSGAGGGPSGGGAPTGGGNPGGGQPGNDPGPGGGTRTADPEAMRKLGDDIDRSTGTQMDAVKQQTQGINVGYPAFGVLGFPLNAAHSSVRDDAVKYLGQGRDQLKNWRDTLHGNADNWSNADGASSV